MRTCIRAYTLQVQVRICSHEKVLHFPEHWFSDCVFRLCFRLYFSLLGKLVSVKYLPRPTLPCPTLPYPTLPNPSSSPNPNLDPALHKRMHALMPRIKLALIAADKVTSTSTTGSAS